MAKPFIKIPGGKSYLLPQLLSALPPAFEVYVEPFVGGGSLFFTLEKEKKLKRTFLGDSNFDTIATWQALKSNPIEVLSTLENLQSRHSRESFLQARGFFNKNIKKELGNPLLAAYFIYLNKTCFNGLIRYNSSGEFNSPPGKYEKPCIFEKENLFNVSNSLEKVELYPGDFYDTINLMVRKVGLNKEGKLKKDVFVYLDPPYLPVSDTAKFTSYTKLGFSVGDHFRIRAAMDYLTSIGGKVLLSNSKSQLTSKIFEGYSIIEVQNKRQIAAQSASRRTSIELLIKNY